ncbi:MAG TPA: cupin domain-containing protein [Terracidiphilus sp.]|nr:cupin domain-containing protein [Terracidiphilus sp.]
MKFSDLLSPVSPEVFFAEYYTEKALCIPGTAGKFQGIFSYAELNRILNSGPIPLPTLKIARQGKPVAAGDAIAILDALQSGATLIIDKIDTYWRPLRDRINEWSEALGEPLQVNLYLSQPDMQGFLTHYDTHDVFILQIAGQKRWRIFEPTVQFPTWEQKDHDRSVPDTPYMDVNLGPGNLLYVPRGHWHDATAHDETSMHLTVGINAPVAVDYLTWLSNELRSRALWRRNLFPPGSHTADAADRRRQIQARVSELEADLHATFAGEETLAAYESYCRASAKKSFAFDLPAQLGAVADIGARAFYRLPGQQVWIDQDGGAGVVRVAVEDRLYTLDAAAGPLLQRIFSSNEFDFGELARVSPDLDTALIEDLLSRLVLDGVIHIREAHAQPVAVSAA